MADSIRRSQQEMRYVALPVNSATHQAKLSPVVTAGIQHARQQQRPRQHKCLCRARICCSNSQERVHASINQNLVAVVPCALITSILRILRAMQQTSEAA